MNSDRERPTPEPTEGKFLSMEEVERRLEEQLAKEEENLLHTLWDLGHLYNQTGRQEQAMSCMKRILQITDDPEKQAGAILTMGQLSEQSKDYPGAISFYTQAMSLEPQNSETWYLINNNLGYCLNIQGKFNEAETYCREAIRIDPARHNAYKNLGISQAGQAQYVDAARNYIQATRNNPRDGRALGLLEQITAEHPEVEAGIPDVQEQLQECRALVRKAGSGAGGS